MNYYGLEKLDALIAQYVTATTGTFVELGAYDGITQNNTLHFEEKGWRGVLIEPVPEAYASCVRNRPLAKTFNCACVPYGHESPMIEMTSIGLMSLVNGSFTDPEKEEMWIARGESIQQIQRLEIKVAARTLDSVLDEARISQPDLLSLDVEGAEIKVLQGLDFIRHRPRFIASEDAYSTDVADLLSSKGYTIKAVLLERKFTRDVLYFDQHAEIEK